MASLRNVLCYDLSPPSFALSFLCHSCHHTHRYFLTSFRPSCLLPCLPPCPSYRPPSPSLSLFFANSTYFLSLCLPRCPSLLPFMLFATSFTSSSSSSVSVRRRSEVGPPAYPHSKGSSPAVAEAKRELGEIRDIIAAPPAPSALLVFFSRNTNDYSIYNMLLE